MRFVAITAITSTLLLAGCRSLTGCNATSLTLALEVTAKDSVTGALVPNATLKSAYADGQAVATVSVGSEVSGYPVNLATAGGTYTVSIAAAGYTTWTQTVVVNGECRPTAVSITALMQKSP